MDHLHRPRKGQRLVQAIVILLMVYFSRVLCDHEENPDLQRRTFYKAGNITIGGMFPVHVRANFRSDYMALAEAMVFAIKKVNKDNYLLPNVTLGFEIYDSCLKSRLAMQTALDFVNRYKFTTTYRENSKLEFCVPHFNHLRSIPAVIGMGNSANSILVSNLLQIENIPLISYAATSDELSKSNVYPSFLRTVPPDRFQSQAMVDLASHFNWSYIAAIAEDNAYGRSGIEHFRKQITPRGICLAMESYFPPGRNETMIKIQKIIQELKKVPKAGVVILYCTKSQAGLVIREAVRQKLPKKTWIASEGWGDTRNVIKPDLLPVIKGLIGVVLPNIIVDPYVEYLISLTSKYRPTSWWKFFWEDEFGCSFRSRNARSNICPDNLKLTREIYTKSLHSSLSTHVINAVYTIAHALDAIYKCREPYGLLTGGACPKVKPQVNPQDLLLYLKSVNFTNTFTSPNTEVTFDSNGDPEGSYTVVNLQNWKGTWDFRKVGSWIAARNPPLRMNTTLIKWNGDGKGNSPKSVCNEICKPGYWQTRKVACCWECIKCSINSISEEFGAPNCTKCDENMIPNSQHTKCMKVPIVHISWHHPIGVAFLLVSVVGMGVTIVIILIFVTHNSTPVVKASNRELIYMLLFCIAMCYLAPVIYLAKPSTLVCVLCQVWFYLFYTTCIAILGAKTNRIVVLFQESVPRSNLAKGLTGRYRHVLFVMVATLLEVIVIIIWVALDPPRAYIDKSTRDQYINTCKPSSNLAGQLCEYILMSLLICASLVCCYFAYKARRLPDNFNEGKFIAFSMYVLVISWVTFYPVFLNIQGMYTVVVLSATTVVAASGLLVCMFVPKIYIIIWRPEKNTRLYMQEQLTNHAFRADTMQAATLHLPGSPRRESVVSTPTVYNPDRGSIARL